MSYAEQSELYRSVEGRGRYEACVREQGLVFAFDLRPDMAALGQAVVSGSIAHIDAVIAAVVFGPSWADLGEDAALLSAVQAQWPTVAAAYFEEEEPA